ncbi:MAG: hypothetical protein IPL63_14055 [Saprospiraceae bacterium]|nr:hypothetical protein [Saprospiraceae bacterium]
MRVNIRTKPSAGMDQNNICPGGSVILTGTGPNTGTWTAQSGNPAGANLGTTNNGVAMASFTNASFGNYCFIYTTNSCSDNMNVKVRMKPSAGSDQNNICPGASTILTGTGPNTGTWTAQSGNPVGANLGTTNNGVAMVRFSNASSGNYFFIYTVNGCTDTLRVNVTMKPIAGMDQDKCGGNNALLAGSGPNSGIWSQQIGNPEGAALSTSSNGMANVSFFNVSSGSYFFIYTANGCTDTMKINVRMKPNAGPDQVGICSGSSTMLTGTGPNSGIWSSQTGNPAGANLSTTNNGIATVIFTNDFPANYFFIYAANGCSDTTRVYVNPLPNVSIDGLNEICEKENESLLATVSINYTYQWAINNIVSSITSHSYPLDSLSKGQYNFSLIVTDQNMCSNTASHFVKVKNVPIVISDINTTTNPGERNIKLTYDNSVPLIKIIYRVLI